MTLRSSEWHTPSFIRSTRSRYFSSEPFRAACARSTAVTSVYCSILPPASAPRLIGMQRYWSTRGCRPAPGSTSQRNV